jgi:hypothetical protein
MELGSCLFQVFRSPGRAARRLRLCSKFLVTFEPASRDRRLTPDVCPRLPYDLTVLHLCESLNFAAEHLADSDPCTAGRL